MKNCLIRQVSHEITMALKKKHKDKKQNSVQLQHYSVIRSFVVRNTSE